MTRQRRTRRTRAEWSALLSEMRENRQSMSAFARAHGLSMSSLAYWKRKLEATSLVAGPKTKPVFSEVVIVPRAHATPVRVEVLTRGGATIRLEGGFDAALLRDVLQVVESC